MDFSRALWWGNFPFTSCSDIISSGNTRGTINVLKSYNLWDEQRAGTVAASLLSIDSGSVAAWVAGLPLSWRTQKVENLPHWWQSSARSTRITELMGVL